MVARPDLPLRDLLRFLIPGILGAGYTEFLYQWVKGTRLTRGNAELLFLVFIVGLTCFASLFHKRLPPWKKLWAAEVKKIRLALAALTDDDRYLKEEHAKPLYKVWLDSDGGTPQLRSHLHYSTGLYYTWAAATVLSALFSAVAFAFALLSFLDACGYASFETAGPGWSIAVAAVGGSYVTWAFKESGKSALQDAVREGVAALHLSESRTTLRRLAEPLAQDERRPDATP